MLQKTANQRSHANVAGHARHLCRKGAGPADNQVDLHASLARPDQGPNEHLIGQRIHLGDDAGGLARHCCCAERVYLQEQLALQIKWRQQQVFELWQTALAGQVHKDVLHVQRQFGVRCQVTHVGVDLRGARVVIAGGQVAVAPELLALTTGEQHHLGMGFKAHHAIQDLRSNGLQHLGPVDVGFLVKPRLELNHHRHLLATAHGFTQQIHQGRIGAGAVNGLLDREHVRVMHRLAQKGQHSVETFKRLVDEYVALAKLLKNRLARRQLAGVTGLVGRETQIGIVYKLDQLRHARQVHGPLHAVERQRMQVEFAKQKARQVL